MKEARLYRGLDGDVECNLCFRRCRISSGNLGFCQVRKNIGGKLYSMVYGKIIAEHVDPIEKKPLYHFHPGSTSYSIATVGCNYRCSFCCNWEISQEKQITGAERTPEQVVAGALQNKTQSISYTYTEPTINMEFAFDTARLANERGLKNTFVTNGSMTLQAVDYISHYLDAATVDFKGHANKEFHVKKMGVPSPDHIFEALTQMKKKGVHVEITDLIVPKEGDSESDLRKLARWIVDNLGPDTPFHLLRFFPNYRMGNGSMTPARSIDRAIEIATEEGLEYTYSGNIPGHEKENTYCPRCRKLLILRHGFYVSEVNLTPDNRCPGCGNRIPIVGSATISPWMFTS